MTSSGGGELVSAFRQKANFMKNWKPASVPSNRDRLELYAWHKQAISGDAPEILQTQSAGERAKYASWRSKRGIPSNTAMRNYITEAERQVRIYGFSNAGGSGNPQQPSTAGLLEQQQPESSPQQPTSTSSRGLAAIPLLCAAASEQRSHYLRRLQTNPNAGYWWKRQEPLTATPGSILAWPEYAILKLATLNEALSIWMYTSQPLFDSEKLASMIQSGLWPFHNVCLATWMSIIVLMSLCTMTWQLIRTVLLGSRRTGRTLASLWKDDILFCGITTINTLTESHQPLSARVVGLCYQPLPFIIHIAQWPFGGGERNGAGGPSNNQWLGVSCVFSALIVMSWWYWICVIPWFLIFGLLGTALLLGNCFAVIELANQI